MSSKRHLRRKSCTGKVQFPTRAEAWRAWGAIKRADHNRGVMTYMNVYHCQFCGQWHIGHGAGFNAYMPKSERFAKS